MNLTKKRHTLASLLALMAAAVPMVLAAPPAYAHTECESFGGPTPSAQVDLQDDGSPDVRVSSVRDVSVCVQADVLVEAHPIQFDSCGSVVGTCLRVYVHPQAGMDVSNSITLCRSVDRVQTCSKVDVGPWAHDTPPTSRICIGIDVNSSSPCGNGDLIGFVD